MVLRKASGHWQKSFSELETDKRKKQSEIRALEKNTTSIQPTIDAINLLLKSFGFRGFSLAKSEKPSHYKIVRADGSAAKETLSEGEASFITFLYFYHLLKGSETETGMTADRVVVFDDPVSSLDSDVLFIVSNLIKGVFEEVRNGVGHIKQVFVMTHNVYFHNEVTFNPRRTNGVMAEETFWVVKKLNEFSTIHKQTSNPIKTSYDLLWAEIRNPNKSNLTIQNTLRRILESYFKILGNVNPDDICGKFEGKEKLICKSLFSWVNVGSHFAHDDIFVSIDDGMIESYLTVFRNIFGRTGHIAHYKMMMGSAFVEPVAIRITVNRNNNNNMNEAETRAEHIDPALKAAGWSVVPGSRIRREYPIAPGRIEGHGKRGKPLTADYILEYRNTKLAVNEAKAWDEALTEGVAQAKNYAGKLAIRYTYATNGQGIYQIDMQTGAEGEIAAYPTPDELWAMTFAKADAWRDRFAAVPFEDKGGSHPSRYYQDIAIDRVMQAIAENKQRILLTFATGTGKTFIAFQIAWKLFHSRWNLSHEPTRRPRILFLADRNILANQAYNAFSAFPEDALVRIAPGDIRKKGKVPKNGSLFFTIFQTFMSGPENTPYFGEYPPDFFDFIVIDECHRGGANDESNWRGIMDYFAPAVQLGLTATPKRDENVDTYRYFGEPVYVYSLKEGINDGFLTPFKVKQIQTTIDYYVFTPDDTVVEGEIEAGKLYDETGFQPKHRNPRTRKKACRDFHVADQPERKDVGVLRQSSPCACSCATSSIS